MYDFETCLVLISLKAHTKSSCKVLNRITVQQWSLLRIMTGLFQSFSLLVKPLTATKSVRIVPLLMSFFSLTNTTQALGQKKMINGSFDWLTFTLSSHFPAVISPRKCLIMLIINVDSSKLRRKIMWLGSSLTLFSSSTF